MKTGKEPRTMFVASDTGKRKMFHINICGHVRNIRPEHRVWFSDEADARSAGYIFCSCCSPVGKIYRKEKAAIDKAVSGKGVKVTYYDGVLYVDTMIGTWKITRNSKRRLTLWHGNTESYEKCRKENGRIIHKYHPQKDTGSSTSILYFVKYIVRHDTWRSEKASDYKALPKNTKRQRKAYRENKRKAEGRAERTVFNLLERLNCEEPYMQEKIEYVTPSDIRKGQPGRKAMNKNRDEKRRLKRDRSGD